jgi:hypothetical protein
MSYIDQLKKLKDEEKLLLDKKKKVLIVRKTEIGRIAEKLDILEIPNELIAGALLQIKNADSAMIERFKKEGERFLKPRSKSSKTQKASAAA